MDAKRETRTQKGSQIAVWTFLNTFVLLAIAIFCFFARLRYGRMFGELGVELPTITRFMIYSPLAIWPAVFVILFFAIWANELISPDATARIPNGIFTLIILAFLAFFIIAIYLPFANLMVSLSLA